jgi:hypothetical protein
MLAIAGRLDRSRQAPAKDLKVMEMRNNGPEAKRLETDSQGSLQRSVYLPLLRGLTPRALEVFDFAEQGFVTGSRDTTTVATQALYLLNDPFVHRQAHALAARLLQPADRDDAARIHLAYRLTMGRDATGREIDRTSAYLAEYEAEARVASKETKESSATKTAAWASFCQALLASAEFRYVK